VRIGLNLLHAAPEIGGGWNYISNLVSALGEVDEANEYVAYVTDVSASLVPSRPNFRSVRIPIKSRIRIHRVVFENTALQTLVWRERLDCMHWFANARGLINAAPAVVTIYDLQPFVPHGQLSRAKRAFLRWQLRQAANGAAMLLPMSQATARGLQEVLGVQAGRMKVISPILESVFAVPAAEAVERCRRRYALPERFWLYVAHLYLHKNHSRLLSAYARLKSEGAEVWPLVLRGDAQPGGPDISALVRELGLQKDVFFLPSLPREELPALYAAASALVFASLYEGAGIPVLEAQASGCPVVAANIEAVREFAGEAAHYFDPLNVDDIARAMMGLAADNVARRQLRDRGLERARRFRSGPVVHDLLAAYEQVVMRARAHTPGRKRNSHGRA
jgi:glycosyltransferase involved in cell wall biosynthesis